MKKYVLSALLVVMLLGSLILLTACGSNELVGKWEGLTNDGLNTTFDFKGDGKVEYSNEYGFNSNGTYEVKDGEVKISLESWGEAKTYKYEIKDGKLKLTATDKYSPSYDGMEKK